MKTTILTLFSLLAAVFFTACSSDSNRKQAYQTPLKISTSSWIGYAPLFYAKEKGYLKPLNIQLLMNISLAESAEVYMMGNADMVTGTQHEYRDMKKAIPSTTAVILLDRSNGADMILSNQTLSTIISAEHIDAYLEIDSINTDLLTDFMKQHAIGEKKFTFINRDQTQLSNITPDNNKNILLVTYSPYDTKLKDAGFHVLASTHDVQDLVVIDALYAGEETIAKESRRLKQFKEVLDRAIDEIMQNKQEGYKTVKGYLNNIDYPAYLKALEGVKWVNHPSKTLLDKIAPMGYRKEYIIP